jgi:hypothetical protein
VSEPLTDGDINEIERHNAPLNDRPARQIRELIAEVRRLRSDEWLEKAIEEATEHFTSDFQPASDLLAILRKHRDGK